MKRSLILIATVALVGCGGSGSTDPDRPSAAERTEARATAPAHEAVPTKAQFLAEADSICKMMGRRLRPWEKQADAADTLPAMLPAARHIAPLAREFARRLNALDLPRQDASTIRHYRSLVSRQAKDIQHLVRVIESGSVADVLRATSKNDDYIAQQRGIAEGLGLRVCGRELS